MLEEALARVLDGEDVPPEVMQGAIDVLMRGEAEPLKVAGFLCALRVKGETPAEIAAAARSLRSHAVKLEGVPPGPLVDTCGTGGDGLDTPNISTMVALVVAAAGCKVAKHGNRSVSSRCGSADLLEELGVVLDPGPEKVAGALEEVGITFLYAPTFHPAMRHAGPIRRTLGVRTLFNVLGPLANPLGASHQVLGVFSPHLLRPLAETLGLLGVTRALVVHGEDGMDEITTRAPTKAVLLEGGDLEDVVVDPAELGIARPDDADLAGGDPPENAAIAREVLGGGGREAVRDLVAVNAGAALRVAGTSPDLPAGLARARELLAEGAPLALLERWVAYLSG